jgi:hypothetical protein
MKTNTKGAPIEAPLVFLFVNNALEGELQRELPEPALIVVTVRG